MAKILRMKKVKEMEGVSNTIKEFSDTYKDLYNSWKYVIEQYESGIEIKYMELDEDNNWIKKNSINIPFSCAKKLFTEILKCLKTGDFCEEDEE